MKLWNEGERCWRYGRSNAFTPYGWVWRPGQHMRNENRPEYFATLRGGVPLGQHFATLEAAQSWVEQHSARWARRGEC